MFTSTPCSTSHRSRSIWPYLAAHAICCWSICEGVSITLTEPLEPDAIAAFAEAELEEQFQVARAAGEHAVVQRLAIIRVGACFQKQPRQLVAELMFRLMDWARLAFAKCSGQGGENVAAIPEKAGVRVGFVCQQQTRDFQCGMALPPRC